MAELELKELILALDDINSAVELAERDYFAKIDEVASYVKTHPHIRVLLLSGPSGSGKTTTANFICDRIKFYGEKSMVLSADDFYLSPQDRRYPKLPSGELDFESPYALDIEAFEKTLVDIVSGKEFSVPKYDFKSGDRANTVKYPEFSHGCVIIEGIHVLNPMFSKNLPKDSVLKLFVSVSTNINDKGRRILSGKKMRFLRRLVRDSIYRGADAKRTLGMWENVLAGEEKYLYPYKECADFKFDTFHIFEPAIMKPYAKKLLTKELTEEYGYAKTVMDGLDMIPEHKSSCVPETSLIKEFIPGGIYEDLY